VKVSNFWVDIENSSGDKYGPGPLRAVRVFRVQNPLSKSGEYGFEVLGADPNISALAQKRIAVCRYVDKNGAIQVFGGGVVDKIDYKSEQGLGVFVVGGNNLSRELNYLSVGSLALTDGAGGGVSDAPDQIMALAPAGWTISDGGATATGVYAGLDGESVLSALVRTGEAIGEHWRLGSGRNIEWLGPASGFASSGVRAVQQVHDPVAFEAQTEIAVILDIQEINDAADVLSRVIPRGAGNGGVQLTLADATDAAPSGYTLSTASNYLKNDAAETAYGRIERVLDFKNIGPISNTTADIQGAANALLEAAHQHLERYSQPLRAYKISIWANTMILPGELLRVVYRQVLDGVVLYDLDDDLIVLGVEHTLDATGLHTSQLTVGTVDRQPLSDVDVLLGQATQGKVVAAHQQLSASVDTLTWRDEMDDVKAANFRFWLGDEYVRISQAIFRFRVQPLRSTVKSISGSSTTTDGSMHTHQIYIITGTEGEAVRVATDAGGDYLVATGGDYLLTALGDTPAHTHTLTPVLATVYGLFEETAGNTLAESNLVYKLNGGSDLGAGVSDIGNGWFELDLTAELVDSAGRPDQENNVLEISTATAKTARIEAQLTVRGVVQAVAYS